MNTAEFLTHLRSLGVEVRANGDRLACNAPKGAITAELRAQLSDRKAEILSFLRQAEDVAAAPVAAIPPAPRDGNLPLSFAQERLWLLSQLDPDAPTYNIPVAARLRGRLDEAVLEKSFTEIYRRHEALRTRFQMVNGQPVQVISEPAPFSLPTISLEELPETEGEAEALRLVRQEAQRPFNLTNGPLFRVLLLRLNPEERILLLVAHHIVADGWSFGVLMQELSSLYNAFLQGKPSRLLDLPIQYGDFAYWQKQRLQGELLSSQLAYWQQQLSGNVPVLQLPTDQPPPLTQSYRGGCQIVELSAELCGAITTVGRQEGVSVFMVLLTAFKMLLNRYAGQEDIVLCSPIAGRKGAETEGLVGYFNNIVVLRTDLSGNPSFRELLGRVRQGVLGAYDHQDVPFQAVAEFPNLSRTPLSKVLFGLEDSFASLLELSGIAVSSLYVDTQTADFDLALFVLEQGPTFALMAKYKTDLFSEGAIAELLGNFQVVLKSIVGDRDQHLLSLPRFREIEPVALVDPFSIPLNSWDKTISNPGYVAPQDELEVRLVKIWEQFLGISPVGIQDNLFDLGASSLLAARLFECILKTFHKNLPFATIFQAPTVEQMAKILRQEGFSSRWRSLAPIQHGGSKTPLFLCQGVGIYSPLVPHLGPDQPLYGLISLVNQDQSNPLERAEDLAAHYIEEIRTIQPEGPYLLGGISFGGIIAYEMAQQLVAQGEKVAVLALFDTILPSAYKWLPWYDRLGVHWKNLWHVGPAYILEKAQNNLYNTKNKVNRAYGKFCVKMGLPLPPHLEYLGMREIHDQAAYQYSPQVYSGRVTIFRAVVRGDEETSYVEPDLGWGKLVTGGLEIHDIPSSHLGILQEPYVQVLAHKLKVTIDRALQTHPSTSERPSSLQRA